MKTNRITTGLFLLYLMMGGPITWSQIPTVIFGTLCILLLPLHFLSAQDLNPDMVFVQGGKFRMGSNLGGKDERPIHDVVLHDFYIGKYEITQQQWRLIMSQDTSKCYFEKCDSCPVERVSWFNVHEFIGKLNEQTGLNYRLPTEAEWEYASSGGSLSKGCKFSGSNADVSVAWKVGNSQAKTHPVGHKKANELGIYDMSGNVFEWCSDWYSSSWYEVSPKENPTGPVQGTFRVIRGGSWFYDHAGLRVTDRESANPEFRYGYIGFRLSR
ncbi:MAG: SUMF1/EgtB/PvdO family nonheme iron enzyme [Bacteroidetes bacterium]|nr:SUMF1/EgtB/PvdO family nonheme iron enzyme [Bacteroidota bacterium]